MSLIGVQTWNEGDLVTVVSDPNTLLNNLFDHVQLASEEFDSAMLITLVIQLLILLKNSFAYIVVALIWQAAPLGWLQLVQCVAFFQLA